MYFHQVLSLFVSLYFCVYAEPHHHSYYQNAYWLKGRHHHFESECDPGWRCVAQRDCHGVIKPWYAPKSRCGRDHTLVCCGPTPGRGAAAKAPGPRRPAPAKAPARPQGDNSIDNEVMSPSERESECEAGWRCVAQRDCHGAVKPWFAPKSRCGRDHLLVCCGPKAGAVATALRRPALAKVPPNAQADSASGDGQMSPSERACSEYSRLKYLVDVVVGGQLAKLYDFPYMVAIGYSRKGRKMTNLFWNCGGTIISNKYVLTAAHCITDAREAALEPTALRVGSIQVPERGPRLASDHAVAEVKLHPGHRPPSRSHDLALLRADPPLKFSALVRPVCLPSPSHSESMEKEHAELWTAGWGATNRPGTRKSTQLRKAKLNALSLDSCKQQYASTGSVPKELDETVLCAAHPTRESDSCSGDSGGPLVAPPNKSGGRVAVVVAITSFGGVPCADMQPGVYARTAPALRWIESVVWPSP